MQKFARLVLILIIILALIPLYARYKEAAGPVPPGVYLAGLDLAGVQDPAEMRQHLDAIYQQPIAVYFADTRLALLPEEIDFYIEVDQMVREAEQFLDGADFIDIAARQTFGYAQRRREVPIRFMLNTDKLRAWLEEEVAATYNRAPTGPRMRPPANRWSDAAIPPIGENSTPPGYVGVYSLDWTWIAGQPGRVLDVEASIPEIVAALTRLDERTAHLVLVETPPPPPAMAHLEEAINEYLTSFPGFGAVYIHDLLSDEEVNVDSDVAFSGMSTLKIGIAAAAVRTLEQGVHPDDATSVQVGQWIDYALGDSNNHAANLMLAHIGNSDQRLGAQRFTEFIRGLGYVNTYMQTGYDEQASVGQIATPANQQSAWNTNPDPNLQTTPREMGRFLSDLYYCTQGSGQLLEVYGDALSPDKCRTVLYYMTHDEFQQMIWAGLPRPDNTWILHKHGFAVESHSDVAMIWSSGGPYVISIFLWRSGWMDWFTSNRAMKTISRITWNFFEFRAQELELEQVPYFILSPPPGYQPILANHIPTVARGD